MTRVLATAGLIAAGLLAGCTGHDTVIVHNRLVPKQQEAVDLQRAFEAGLLSPEEYEQQKHMLGL